MENTQEAKEELRKQKRQMKDFQDTTKLQDQRFMESEILSKENGKLKQELEKTLRVTDSDLEEQARKLKKREEEHSRELEMNKREMASIAEVSQASPRAAKETLHMQSIPRAQITEI